jgi:hypothetical protein
MSEEDEDLGQMIYLVGIKIAYKVKRGNGYINNYRTMEIPTRMKSVDDINSSPEMIMNLMASLKLTGKKIFDFHVKEEYFRKEVSRSIKHKEKDYGKKIEE